MEMLLSDWIIGLFSSTIPIRQIPKFYTLMFRFGWVAFYRVVINILKKFEKEMMNNKEAGDIVI